jgi:ribosome-binding protein aMBF1 (putative translation factor)
MSKTAAVAGAMSFDVTEVGREEVRACLRDSVRAAADCAEYERFWEYFPFEAACHRIPRRMLVVADLARIVNHYRGMGNGRWLASVRRVRPYFLALVRTKRDERCASLIDDLMRYSDHRMSVCGSMSCDEEVRECLSAALAALDPEALVEVRYSPAREDELWVEFGDGLSGYVDWAGMGVCDVAGSLVRESATAGVRGKAIELTTKEGELFEIDSLSVRSILDRDLAREVSLQAAASDEAVGQRLRAARKSAGLTQVELGERAELDQAVISRLENGTHQPRVDTLERVAAALDMSLADLLAFGRA